MKMSQNLNKQKIKIQNNHKMLITMKMSQNLNKQKIKIQNNHKMLITMKMTQNLNKQKIKINLMKIESESILLKKEIF